MRSTTLSHAEHKLFDDYRRNRRRPSLEKLGRMVALLYDRGASIPALEPLQELIDNLLFLPVASVEPGRAHVYDLTVPGTHSFVANGFVNHNTYLAVAQGVQSLLNKSVERIVLARPAVEAGEKLGFLPGDLQEKVDPYLRPLYDSLYDLVDFEKVSRLMERNAIEVAPIAFMRGRTFNDAFVIIDEAQNTTTEQMKTAAATSMPATTATSIARRTKAGSSTATAAGMTSTRRTARIVRMRAVTAGSVTAGRGAWRAAIRQARATPAASAGGIPGGATGANSSSRDHGQLNRDAAARSGGYQNYQRRSSSSASRSMSRSPRAMPRRR